MVIYVKYRIYGNLGAGGWALQYHSVYCGKERFKRACTFGLRFFNCYKLKFQEFQLNL